MIMTTNLVKLLRFHLAVTATLPVKLDYLSLNTDKIHKYKAEEEVPVFTRTPTEAILWGHCRKV